MVQENTKLPPLTPRLAPLVPVETLVAVGVVVLKAGEVPREKLREFYERVIGLQYLDADASAIRFRYQQREVILDRKRPTGGRLGLAVRGFSEMLVRLHDNGVAFELVHTDVGMTRTAMVHDPAGNWVQLVEVRPI